MNADPKKVSVNENVRFRGWVARVVHIIVDLHLSIVSKTFSRAVLTSLFSFNRTKGATLGALLIWVCAARGQAPDFSATKGAAERGDAVAQSDLGVMLVDGLGVPKDEVEGVKWFRKA